jgi:ABC-type transporter Mla subunit MlaD
MAEEILIEFVTRDEDLDASIDKLNRLGAVDQKQADTFKRTNAELNKRGQALNSATAAQSRSTHHRTGRCTFQEPH